MARQPSAQQRRGQPRSDNRSAADGVVARRGTVGVWPILLCSMVFLVICSGWRSQRTSFVRWLEEVRRFKPPTVSRRLSVVTCFYRTCVIDGLIGRHNTEILLHDYWPGVRWPGGSRSVGTLTPASVNSCARSRVSVVPTTGGQRGPIPPPGVPFRDRIAVMDRTGTK